MSAKKVVEIFRGFPGTPAENQDDVELTEI